MAAGLHVASCVDYVHGVFVEYGVRSRDKIISGSLESMRVSCNSPFRAHEQPPEGFLWQASFILPPEI